ncbi:thioredoxin-like protein [Baffinella frigidus]|nr:thioredoxin-like protein [Cryptophyta sp. CCMP2293]|mmetsp:Transcript_29897/g.71124  ORF Transcript_29897/g.71124 Transcript_29897/m.71124 type:complete len:290 (-) Transcript_29897:95-964(-)
MHTSHMLLLAAGSAASVAAFAPAPLAGLRPATGRTSTCSAAALKMLKTGETFPDEVAGALGVKGKNAVVFFFGADGSPSCSKEVSAFSSAAADFKALNFEVVGVRNAKEAKGEFAQRYDTRLVADEGNALRNRLDIKGDFFGALAGRETYVIDKAGSVKLVFNDQFKPEEHVSQALAMAKTVTPAKSGRQGSIFGSFSLPNIALPTFGTQAVTVPLVKNAAPTPAPTGRQGSIRGGNRQGSMRSAPAAAPVKAAPVAAKAAPAKAAPAKAAPAKAAGAKVVRGGNRVVR